MPASLSGTSGLSQYPATALIESIRLEAGGIRGDAPLLMLQTIVQGVERQLASVTDEKNLACSKLDAAQGQVTSLSIENAELKKDVQHMLSERSLRNTFLALGGLGAGVTIPVAIDEPNVSNISYAIVFMFILAGALFLPSSKGQAK